MLFQGYLDPTKEWYTAGQLKVQQLSASSINQDDGFGNPIPAGEDQYVFAFNEELSFFEDDTWFVYLSH